jgi:hypothetical protein
MPVAATSAEKKGGAHREGGSDGRRGTVGGGEKSGSERASKGAVTDGAVDW